MTNAERIRSMTDEEMAKTLLLISAWWGCCEDSTDFEHDLIDWLQEEVEDKYARD